MDKYLIKYLKDHAENELTAKYIDFFKIELDWHIYNSESHIAKAYHRKKDVSIYSKLIFIYQSIFAMSNKASSSTKRNILSTLKFNNNNISEVLNAEIYTPIWHPLGKEYIIGDQSIIKWHRKIQNLIQNENFNSLLDPNLHKELEEFQSHFIKQYNESDFRALFLYTDQYFYSKYFIDIFKKLEKPSFVFSHGLPGIYTKEVDNRSDYLLVWSEKIKENYIKVGFNSEKIKVVGNPNYRVIPKDQDLKSDFSDILVIPVSHAPWHQHEYDETIVGDKSTTILYLYKLQKVLKELGIQSVRYRPHPSVNKAWLHAFLDQSFYKLDVQPLSDSLKRTSLVIGGTSTVLLEALILNVNYVCFEPKDEQNKNIVGIKLVPPFDGSEPKLCIANDEVELKYILKNNIKTDYSLLQDYIQDFDVSIVKDLIK